MTHSLRFGIMVLQNLPYPELVEHYRHIEALGYDSAWVADHFVDPYVPDKPWFDGYGFESTLKRQPPKSTAGDVTPRGRLLFR